jgi:DNA-binding response OmpR family regulator
MVRKRQGTAADAAPAKAPAQSPIRCGRLSQDPAAKTITCDGIPIDLAPMEYTLLSVFMKHSGEVLPRSFLLKQVWDTDYMGDTRMLDVHIRWLRRKIEDDPSKPTYLRTVRGVGYRFAPPPSSEA